jgi:hypothetical protein
MTNEETNTQNVKVFPKEDWQKSPEVVKSLVGVRVVPDDLAVVAFHKAGVEDCEVCITCTRRTEDGIDVPLVIVLSWNKAVGLAAGLVDVLESLEEYENSVVTNEEAAEASDSESTPPSEEGQANHE